MTNRTAAGWRACRLTLVGLSIALPLLTAPALALDTVTVRILGVGNDDRRASLQQRLRRASLTAQIVDDEDLAVPATPDLLGLAQSEYSQLLGVLYSEGYYGPTISVEVDGREAAEIDPFRPPQEIDRIVISVAPNRIFRFGQTEVTPLPPGTETPLVEGFARGERARSDLVGAAARAGISEWRDEGHAKATVEGETIVAVHPEARLDVEIDLAPGPLLRFGTLTVRGDTDVSEQRVRQMLGFPQGEVFSPQELRDAVNRLRRSGVFRVVTLEAAEEPNPDGTLDYTLTLIDEAKRRIGFSAEYSTLDGLTASAFWLHRNLFGGAERFRVDAEVRNIGGDTAGLQERGGVDYLLGFRLTRPGTFGADNDLFLFGLLQREDEPEFTEDSFEIGAGVTRYFSDDLFAEAAAALRYSDVTDAFGTREFYHLTFPSNLEWDKRDNEGDPLSGFYLDVAATPYLGLEADSQDGATIEADGRAYASFGGMDRSRVTLAGRVQIGSVVGSDLDATPQDFLFYSGGGNTVRGQEYQSLGVEVEDDRLSGGRSFLGLSAELRTRITNALGLVAFYDVGYVGRDSFIDEDAGMHSGTGLGIRYATAIGPIRVDLATPVAGDRDAYSAVELYIGVGQAF